MILPRHQGDPAILFGGAALLYAGASLTWTEGSLLWASLGLTFLVVGFGLGRMMRNVERIWLIFLVGVAANLATVLLVPSMPYGLFGNPNYFGCAIALAIAGALAYGYNWFIPFGLLGQAMMLSRGAIFATGVSFLVVLWSKSKMAAIGAVAGAIALMIVVKPEGATSATTIGARMGVWQDTLNHLTFFGRGFGSFFEAYSTFRVHTNMVLERPAHAYNDAVELLFDLGIGAVPLWVLMVIAISLADQGQRLICITFFALGLTFFPLYIFPLGLLFMMTVGQATQGVSYEMASRYAAPNRRASA